MDYEDAIKLFKVWFIFVVFMILGLSGFGIWVVIQLLKHFGVI